MGLITDRRFSGSIYGMVVGHDQKHQSGGAIALIQEGDNITIDTPPRLLQLNISDEELARCRANWQPAAPR